MYRQIRKKLVILGNRRPFKREVETFIGDVQRVDWVYMNMRLEGSILDRNAIECILNKKPILSGTIGDFMEAQQLERLFAYLQDQRKRHRKIDEELIKEMYSMISEPSGDNKRLYRKDAPVLFHLGYTPTLKADIDSEMRVFINWCGEEEFDIVKKAAGMHNWFMKIYPFPENNGVIARGIMYYYLMCQGLPMGALSLKEEEYNSNIFREITGREKELLYDSLLNSTINMLNFMLRLTDYDS